MYTFTATPLYFLSALPADYPHSKTGTHSIGRFSTLKAFHPDKMSHLSGAKLKFTSAQHAVHISKLR